MQCYPNAETAPSQKLGLEGERDGEQKGRRPDTTTLNPSKRLSAVSASASRDNPDTYQNLSNIKSDHTNSASIDNPTYANSAVSPQEDAGFLSAYLAGANGILSTQDDTTENPTSPTVSIQLAARATETTATTLAATSSAPATPTVAAARLSKPVARSPSAIPDIGPIISYAIPTSLATLLDARALTASSSKGMDLKENASHTPHTKTKNARISSPKPVASVDMNSEDSLSDDFQMPYVPPHLRLNPDDHCQNAVALEKTHITSPQKTAQTERPNGKLDIGKGVGFFNDDEYPEEEYHDCDHSSEHSEAESEEDIIIEYDPEYEARAKLFEQQRQQRQTSIAAIKQFWQKKQHSSSPVCSTSRTDTDKVADPVDAASTFDTPQRQVTTEVEAPISQPNSLTCPTSPLTDDSGIYQNENPSPEFALKTSIEPDAVMAHGLDPDAMQANADQHQEIELLTGPRFHKDTLNYDTDVGENADNREENKNENAQLQQKQRRSQEALHKVNELISSIRGSSDASTSQVEDYFDQRIDECDKKSKIIYEDALREASNNYYIKDPVIKEAYSGIYGDSKVNGHIRRFFGDMLPNIHLKYQEMVFTQHGMIEECCLAMEMLSKYISDDTGSSNRKASVINAPASARNPKQSNTVTAATTDTASQTTLQGPPEDEDVIQNAREDGFRSRCVQQLNKAKPDGCVELNRILDFITKALSDKSPAAFTRQCGLKTSNQANALIHEMEMLADELRSDEKVASSAFTAARGILHSIREGIRSDSNSRSCRTKIRCTRNTHQK